MRTKLNRHAAKSIRRAAWARIVPASKCVTPKCVAIRRIVGNQY